MVDKPIGIRLPMEMLTRIEEICKEDLLDRSQLSGNL